MTVPTHMHGDEAPTDLGVVRRLVAEQFPRRAPRPVAVVASTGTANAMYRLGDDFVVRQPRTNLERHASRAQQRLELVGRHGSAQQEALRLVATERAHGVELALGLDAFRHHAQA